MTPAFLDAFERLIGHEGEFQNDPRDDGNWTGGAQGLGECRGTKYGISARTYPNLDIENLTLEDARGVYWMDFWQRVGADRLPGELGFQVFDAAVHSGPERAVAFLQRALGVAADGDWGPATEAAFTRALPQAAALVARFNGARLDFLTRASRWPAFSTGWARRIAANLLAVNE